MDTGMAQKVFISYRRDDSKWQAREIYRALTAVLPRDHVFMDIDSIPPGADFVEVLEGWVEKCDVLLAVIGPGWAEAVDPKTGRRRLENPNDFVRIEIRRALVRGIPVVPVLLDRAPIPDEDQLPDDLKRLTRRQAEFIEHRTVDADVERLIRRLGLREGVGAPVVPPPVVAESPKVKPWQESGEVVRKLLEAAYPPPEPPLSMVVERPDVTERRELEAAVQRGEAGAQVELGLMHENGRVGLDKNDAEAVRLYKLAADQGDASGQAKLGLMYASGRGGLAQNDAEAARLFKLAADQGNAAGQSCLGIALAYGEGGLAKNEAEAVRLFKLAVDQGNDFGQIGLGHMFMDGLGGLAKNEAEALRLYKLAADQGNAVPQIHLAEMYENGRIVAQNKEEAIRLYKLAAAQGDDEAIEALKRLKVDP